MERRDNSEESKERNRNPRNLVLRLSQDHTRFLDKTLPGLRSLAAASGNLPMARFLENLSDELLIHFRTEERLVFPLILSRLEHSSQAIEPALRLACDHMRDDHRTHMRHLNVLHAFHDQIDSETENGSELCEMLQGFCLELEEHSELENKILFRCWPMVEDELRSFPDRKHGNTD